MMLVAAKWRVFSETNPNLGAPSAPPSATAQEDTPDFKPRSARPTKEKVHNILVTLLAKTR